MPAKRQFSKKDFKKFPARTEFQEFGPGRKPFLLCSECENVYWKKSWHSDFPPKIVPEKRDVRFAVCPACKMAKGRTFEGQIIIRNVPVKVKKDLLNLIKNSDKQARAKDPQDRVLQIRAQGSNVEVQTSENQLAVRLAKKIAQTFIKPKKPKITYSREGNDIARATITF